MRQINSKVYHSSLLPAFCEGFCRPSRTIGKAPPLCESMDADLLPELSGETWEAATLLEGLTADLLPAGADLDLIVASHQDTMLTTVRELVQSGIVPSWTDCAGLSPELRCWRLQLGNL